MHQLDVDRLDASELRSLDAARQIDVLNDLFGEIKRLSDVKCEAIDAVADARMKAITEPTPVNKAAVINAKRSFDKVGVAIAARKQQTSILQSLLRGVPA